MTMLKTCTKCGRILPITEFSKNRQSPDGLQYWCNPCKNKRDYSYTGQASRMYSQQRNHSIHRGHALPLYTRKEFITWCIANPKYIELHDAWVDSGYKIQLVPSADRIDNSKGYMLSNLQMMTWEENRLKEARVPTTRPHTTKVIQFTKTGEYITTHLSAAHAAKALNKNARANIVHVCRGRSKSAYGYLWQYTS